MDRDERRRLAQVAGGAGIFGGGAVLAAESGNADRAVNRAHARVVAGLRDRAAGTLGGLDPAGRPVDPLALSGKRGGKRKEGGRYPSPRAQAREAFQTKVAPYEARLAKPPIRGKAGALVRTGTLLGGLGTAYVGSRMVGQASEHGRRSQVGPVAKAEDTLEVSPQYGVGIPPQRAILSPLAMHASTGIMADLAVGAMGKRLTRRERKRIRSGAYQFAGAQGMVFSPLGHGTKVTGT